MCTFMNVDVNVWVQGVHLPCVREKMATAALMGHMVASVKLEKKVLNHQWFKHLEL